MFDDLLEANRRHALTFSLGGLPAAVRVEGWRYSVDNGLVTRVVSS